MAIKWWIRRLANGGSALAMLLGFAPASFGQVTLGQPSCGTCQTCDVGSGNYPWHCPPAYIHCQEGAPRISIHCGCPKPVCCPHDLPSWGYFQTCWRPFPYAQMLAHCPTVPVISTTVVPVTNSGIAYGNAPVLPTVTNSGSSYGNAPAVPIVTNSGSAYGNAPIAPPPAAGSGSIYNPTPTVTPGSSSGGNSSTAPVVPTAPKSGSVYNIAPPAAPAPKTGTINNPIPVLPPAPTPSGVHSMPLQPSTDMPGQRSTAPPSIIRPGT